MYASSLLRIFWFTGFLTCFFTLTSCDSAENVDNDGRIAGDYETTLFIADIEGNTVDVFDAGGFIEMTLRENKTVSGRLFIPETLAEGEQSNFSLDGTYRVSGNVVTFDHEADTFVRDVEWVFENGTLRTETDGITVVLQRE